MTSKSLFILLCLIFLSLLFYQVEALVKGLYLLRTSETEFETFLSQVKKLELEFSEKSSLLHLEEYLKNSRFTKAQNPKFFEVLESGVVAK